MVISRRQTIRHGGTHFALLCPALLPPPASSLSRELLSCRHLPLPEAVADRLSGAGGGIDTGECLPPKVLAVGIVRKQGFRSRQVCRLEVAVGTRSVGRFVSTRSHDIVIVCVAIKVSELCIQSRQTAFYTHLCGEKVRRVYCVFGCSSSTLQLFFWSRVRLFIAKNARSVYCQNPSGPPFWSSRSW